MHRAGENIEQLDTDKCGADGIKEVYEEDRRLLSEAQENLSGESGKGVESE